MGLFHKKKRSEEPPKSDQEPVIDKAQLQQTISEKEQQLEGARDSDVRAALYEAIGLAQMQLDDQDAAIVALEKSLAARKSLGEAYKALLRLYNKKRAEAATNGDEAMLTHYMEEIDGLMQLSKDITRGKI